MYTPKDCAWTSHKRNVNSSYVTFTFLSTRLHDTPHCRNPETQVPPESSLIYQAKSATCQMRLANQITGPATLCTKRLFKRSLDMFQVLKAMAAGRHHWGGNKKDFTWKWRPLCVPSQRPSSSKDGLVQSNKPLICMPFMMERFQLH